MGRSRAHLVMHKQHVLAPFDRLVAAAEDLMRPGAAEETRSLESRPHAVAQAREPERDVVLLAIVAELDQAEHRGGIEAWNGAEIEHDIAHGFFMLRLDHPLDPLEQAV